MVRTERLQRTDRLLAAWLVALLSVALAPAAPFGGLSAVAAEATTVDLSPEAGSGPTGDVVVLTARVYDENGDLYAGAGTSTHVRFFFDSSSPNDIDSPGNSSDLDCMTGILGLCTVSYVATAPGTDVVCAVLAGPTSQCDDEAVGDAERDDRADAVQHTNPGMPLPTPTP
ncbi:MAG TPA: hypothetical protein VHK05_02855, partial [Candidatus Limnocylindrales bacterium]|nr:hypothetical protein [Candidatus Limnocylindrales bacterium]